MNIMQDISKASPKTETTKNYMEILLSGRKYLKNRPRGERNKLHKLPRKS